jgi:hypothetical protein
MLSTANVANHVALGHENGPREKSPGAISAGSGDSVVFQDM